MSATVEKLYSGGEKDIDSASLPSRLAKVIDKERKRLQRRLQNIDRELQRQQGFERYRQQGELLLANRNLLKRGLDEVWVENYYTQPPEKVQIPLDTIRTPQENIDRYFQLYKKARRGIEHSTRRKTETESELAWLEQLDFQLHETQDSTAIAEIAEELRRAGLLKEPASRLPKAVTHQQKPYREAQSPNGFRVLWGISSKQNDALSTRELKRGDLWFHAHNCPGSHVLLKAREGAFAEEDILFAASLAAANSRARQSEKVEVMMAEAKKVHKPSGAKPGMVTVKRYKTLVVRPFAEGGRFF